MANKRRGASFARKASRAGFSKLQLDANGMPTGVILKRPYGNQSSKIKGGRKPKFRIQVVTPMMTVEKHDPETGEAYTARVRKTVTKEVERRVFLKEANMIGLPEGVYAKEVWHMGNIHKGTATFRTRYFRKEIIEELVPSFTVRHTV